MCVHLLGTDYNSPTGSVNVMMTNPLWVVNTRIKMQGVSRHKTSTATAPAATAAAATTATTHQYKGILGRYERLYLY